MQTTINKALITFKKFNKKDTSFYCKELQQPTHHSKTKKRVVPHPHKRARYNSLTKAGHKFNPLIAQPTATTSTILSDARYKKPYW